MRSLLAIAVACATGACIRDDGPSAPGQDAADPLADPFIGRFDSGDDFPRPVVSDVPVLVLAGDLDARTPVENGEDIIRTLTRARLVVVENAAHQFDVFGSAPIRAVLAAFLAGTPLPASRVSLPPIPFVP